MKSKINNCITIDVEGFCESNLESFRISEEYLDRRKEDYEITKNIDFILELLEKLGIKATFFILGRIAKDLPHIVNRISKQKHEVACHGMEHKRIFNYSKDEFKKITEYAKKYLEDSSGQAVIGFRAPDFSITNKSIWALDTLVETGFKYDSSIYPLDIHDVYGIKNYNRTIQKLSNGLIEFPLSTFSIFGKQIPFGGGGYFRLYPVVITEYLISKVNNSGLPVITYIHPYEIGPIIPYIHNISIYRRFRHYYNCNNGFKRLMKILKKYNFTTVVNVLKERNFI